MPHEGELAAHGPAIDGQIVPEHRRGARAQREEPGQEPQQGRLSGSVRPREQHDLTVVDVEIGTRERRKAVEQAHGRADAHDGQRGPPRPGSGTARVYGDGPDVGELLRRATARTPVVSMIVRRTAASLGRMLVTVGLLILLFVAYQLWGTGIFTARAQNDLKKEFNSQLQDNPTVQTTAPPRTGTTLESPNSTVPPTTLAKVVQTLNEGDPAGRIRIPKIHVDLIFVQGTARDDLSKGPGHYPASPMPGQLGNAAIAGHRTTHGKPFYDLDQLAPGDDILIDTTYGHYRYRVTQQLIVAPTEVSVVGPTPDAQLTLTTCNPKLSARERLVIHAKLVVEKSTPARATVPGEVVQPKNETERNTQASLQESLSGDTSSRLPSFFWGFITVLFGAVWWWFYRRWRHPATWLAGVLPFLIVLFVFHVYFERLLPANF